MKPEYKRIPFRKLKKMDYNPESPKYIEIKGIPRAVQFHIFGKKFEERYNYSTNFFLQKNKNLVYVYNHNSRDHHQNIKEQLLKTASEGNLEIDVRGLFEGSGSRLGYTSIYWYELAIDGCVLERDSNNPEEV